jgi:hypothetical protein
MSGVISGIAKIFKPIVSVATKIIKPIAAVGATLFTGGAALGAGPAIGGGLGGILSLGGTLANIAGTAFGRAGWQGAGAQGSGTATAWGGQDVGGGGSPPRGLMSGTVGNGLGEGSSSYDGGGMSFSGNYAEGVGDVTQQNITTPTTGGGLFGSVQGGSMLAGLGGGLSQWMQSRQEQRMMEAQLKSREKIAQNELDFMRDKEERVRDSYRVAPSAHESAPQRVRYQYDRESGRVVPVSA